jgi:hypothetical protein
MTTPNTDDTIEWAAEEGGGEGAGAPSGKTVMTKCSFERVFHSLWKHCVLKGHSWKLKGDKT